MDVLLFEQCLSGFDFVQEETKYLEILTFEDEKKCSDSGVHKLGEHDFDNFVRREGVFASPALEGVTSGLRLVIQDAVQDPKAFNHNVMSFSKEQYRTLAREMQLQLQVAESSSVVGPFFWWGFWRDLADPENEFLQLVFRKSDVRWKGTSRGWEMALSYSFRTGITSGYVRGTSSAGIEALMEPLATCARLACHPFLLPVLMLGADLSPKTENNQRQIRDTLRSLESAVDGGRYNMAPAEGYGSETDIKLDQINRELADLQCRVMWKRPQVWQGTVGRLDDATRRFWDRLSNKKVRNLEGLHATLQERLDFTAVRLAGLESYTQVSLERLNIQRQVMNSFISQRESRLSLAIAAQQRRLALAAGRESTSMKTLAVLGAIFLPGAFVSSILGMSFFDFGDDINNHVVSPLVWIYFAISIPLTVLVVGSWWTVDQRRLAQANAEVSDDEMSRLESRIMKAIRTRTGARVTSMGPHLVHSGEHSRRDYADVGKPDQSRQVIARWLQRMTSWRQQPVTSSASEA